MLAELLQTDKIRTQVQADTWQEAVKQAALPLAESGAVEPGYIDRIIECTHEMGPYYVVGPGIALPHARPEDGVNQMGLSLITLSEPVEFGADENDPVKLLVTLAAVDSDKHVDALTSLAELFCNEDDVETIMAAQDPQAVRSIIEKYI